MPKAKHTRRSARETVLQALYAVEVGQEHEAKALKDILDREKRDEEINEFIVELFEISLKNRDWCENEIKSRLNNWEFERVAVLDRLLLILAISEIFFIDNIPPKVSIAEAIEIAKQFSTEESSAFINGVLDNIYKSLPKVNEVVST
ncbi:MAG: transcription antitermination factor NusB [Candidatus Marinimicrobia bacterium]|nr:transcription antitermination factor NusB [Candidatus Neomarinimicrobiota bacterium]MBO01052.1 transcription antitermination factor NusB [Candidatus Neomarinimicrobiota bacterium]|tara:strand:- start:24 stop:464 length:441 start_codon:yes stop_codon:yes gene_type:complete